MQRNSKPVLDLARRLPQLNIVINHLGRPPIPEQGWEPWAAQIARAAEYRNLAMKLSIGLDVIMRWRWSTPAIRRYSDHVLDLFGPERMMAGDPVGRALLHWWPAFPQTSNALCSGRRRRGYTVCRVGSRQPRDLRLASPARVSAFR